MIDAVAIGAPRLHVPVGFLKFNRSKQDRVTVVVDNETFSSLVGSIYDCALDPARWSSTLTELRLALSFHNAVMGVMAMPSGSLLLNVTSGVEGQWLERMPEYGAEVVEQWGGWAAINSHPFGEPAVLSWKRPRSEWADNRYVVEWVKPQGIFDVMGLAVARDAQAHGSIGLGRHTSAGEISQREVDGARLLLPHIQRSLAISRALDLKTVVASTFAATLDALTASIMLVDADLEIVHVNKAAEAMLVAGASIKAQHGRLRLLSHGSEAALAGAVRQAAEKEAELGRRGFGIPVAQPGGEPTMLYVLPLRHGSLRPGLSPNAAAAIIMTRNVGSKAAPSEALSALFDLTAAEAKVFSLIAAGKSVAQAARALDVQPSTAKTHLLRIFSKTGTHRQADLIRLSGSLSLP